MSKIGKIAPIIVILACIGSLFFAFKINGIKTGLKADKERLTGDLNNTQKQLASTKADLAKKTEDLTKSEDEKAQIKATLTATELARDKFKTEAEDTKTKLTQSEQQLADAKTKIASNDDELKKLRAQVESEEFKNAAETGKKLAVVEDENKLLTDQLTQVRAQNKDLATQVQNLLQTPQGVQGKVAQVEEKWNIVVLDIGRDDHVRTNTQFVVYRDRELVSKINIVTVYDKVSVGEILPGFDKTKPRVGDRAIYGKL